MNLYMLLTELPFLEPTFCNGRPFLHVAKHVCQRSTKKDKVTASVGGVVSGKVRQLFNRPKEQGSAELHLVM